MKSKNVLKVINNFKKVLPLATRKRHLDMEMWRVNMHGHKCGTVHCHGGWYAVATGSPKKEMNFQTGTRKMAKHLGFKDEDALIAWAATHPKLWGNYNGSYIFVRKIAFKSNKNPKGAKTLQDIIDHWKAVYKRVKRQEA